VPSESDAAQGALGLNKAAESRRMAASGECQMLLAKAIEGDREREVRDPSGPPADSLISTAPRLLQTHSCPLSAETTESIRILRASQLDFCKVNGTAWT
jgi:hypothetical protein